MQKPVSEELAQKRWMIIQIMRWIGFAMVIFGILLSQGAITVLASGNEILGYVLVVVGLLDGFFVPVILARKWRSPDR